MATLNKSEENFKNHTGFLLYDPHSHRSLIDYNASKYFTPASNTKIFTLYGGLHLLGDSIPALRYIIKGDSLIFWGTGDPSFLYGEVFQNNRTYEFLSASGKKLFFSAKNFNESRLGPGWSWDDYNHSYSPERSPFPITGNCISFSHDSVNNFDVRPAYFANHVVIPDTLFRKAKLSRDPDSNQVTYTRGYDSASWERLIPFRYSPDMLVELLSDTIKKTVEEISMPIDPAAKYFYGIPADSLYKVMMQESDNFIAEQLLLLYAGIISDTLEQQIAIDSIKSRFLFDLPDDPVWKDGSGLSRYNLFTPATIVRLWEKISALVPQERLFKLLAVGGEKGTIRDNYKGEMPYVFGKTGTLRNNHCLSGFLITTRGKVLIFSFMNNNYTASSAEIKRVMEKVLLTVRDKY
jgi:D-alanyl-D-alanine carboxypeptidase/D-alanyl-D-alanine-endopeptidase (penicillin-binding protein 4)